jgi:hypothetical protein
LRFSSGLVVRNDFQITHAEVEIHAIPDRRDREEAEGGATVADVKRLRELKTENAKLKRMYGDLVPRHRA